MSENRPLEKVETTLPIALAVVLPFGAYGQIPIINVSLCSVLLVVMAGATLRQCIHQRRLRPPFEYWWPSLVVVPAALVLAVQGDADDAYYLIQLVLAMLIPVTLAAHRMVACSAVTAFGMACGAGALMHFAADFGWIPPTVVYVPGNLLLAGPDSLATGLLLMLSGLLAGLVALIHPDFTAVQRRLTGVALLPMGAWLCYVAAHTATQLSPWASVAFFQRPLPVVFAVLLGLWIAARVSARAVLVAKKGGNLRRMAFPLAIGTGAVAHVLTGTPPGVASIFLLGLAAALDSPWTRSEPIRRAPFVWAVPLACVLVQVLGLCTLSDGDPRNQVARGARLLENRSWEALEGTLDCLMARQPADPELSLLDARMLLARDRPNEAAEVFCAIAYNEESDTPFLTAARKQFLDDLRDVASAQPPHEAHFFFERVLIHVGKGDQAESLLEIRRSRSRTAETVIGDRETLQRGLYTLLGVEGDGLALADWEGAEFFHVLTDGGVAIRPLPEDDGPGPVLLYGRLGVKGVLVRCAPLGPLQADVQMDTPYREGSQTRTISWQSWQESPEGTWSISLDSDVGIIATCSVGADTELSITIDAGGGPRESIACDLFVP